MGIATGPGIWKFISIAFVLMIFLIIIAEAINGVIEWRKTGDKTKLVEATLGKIVYFDGQIDIAMQQLKNTEFINQIPLDLRESYKTGLARQVLLNLFVFLIIGFLLYKLGNWLSGKSQFEPTTDLIIVVVIIAFLALSEFVYGLIMHRPNIIPFKGILNWLTNLGVWWDALSGTITTNIQPVVENVSTTAINLGG